MEGGDKEENGRRGIMLVLVEMIVQQIKQIETKSTKFQLITTHKSSCEKERDSGIDLEPWFEAKACEKLERESLCHRALLRPSPFWSSIALDINKFISATARKNIVEFPESLEELMWHACDFSPFLPAKNPNSNPLNNVGPILSTNPSDHDQLLLKTMRRMVGNIIRNKTVAVIRRPTPG
ncbi:hypothetical protein SDJN02_20930, partial [Cucurbita argyrosperma subsp. argyrosperma]